MHLFLFKYRHRCECCLRFLIVKICIFQSGITSFFNTRNVSRTLRLELTVNNLSPAKFDTVILVSKQNCDVRYTSFE